MSAGRSWASRRLIWASLALGLFVLLDLGLLGWMIFRSLSQREIERVLFETRQEAEGLARRLAGRAEREGEDLYTVTAMEREVQTYIDSILKQRRLVQAVEVVDSEGRLVFRGSGETTLEVDPERTDGLEQREVPQRIEERPVGERQRQFRLGLPIEDLYRLDVPIGKLGFLHVGISQDELESRIEVLRWELVRTTLLISILTLAMLAVAYVIIWWLWRRGRRFAEQAEEAERMAYIGTLASGLAHEIRNPLNSLSLNMQMLEEEMGQRAAPGRRRLMALTRSEIARLERLVTDFLRYAKPQPLEVEELPAVDLLTRSREVMASELEARRARLEIEDRSAGARVRVDPAQMTQLLLNLIQNALAATEESGRPLVVQLRALRSAGRVVLEVVDRGVGIAPQDQQKIFELFYSTRKGGTGLGLAVVERIAKAHHGELEVRSGPGRGTSVRLELPLARPLPEPALAPAAVGPASS